MMQDFRYAIRGLRRAPLFSIIVVTSLALGIGANTALFSLMDRLLWRSLPVHAPEELVVLENPRPNIGRQYGTGLFSYPLYRDLRDRNTVFDGLIARFPTPVSFTWREEASQVDAEIVTGNYFDVLGVPMAKGRGFLPEEDRTPLANPVAVLNHGFWLRRLGGAGDILGKKLLINAKPFTVVGVTAPGFQSVEVGRSVDIYLPVMMKAHITPEWDAMENRRIFWLRPFGRLKAGVTRQQAEEALSILWKPILEAEAAEFTGVPQDVRQRFLNKRIKLAEGDRGVSGLRDRFEKPMFLLLAMVGLLLLIACVNVASLLLARAMDRQKEIAVRLALGAGKGRVIRQLLAESMILALTGGAAGLLVAAWAGSLLLQFLPEAQMVRSLSSEFDVRMFLFTLALSVSTGLLFGLAPVLQALRPNVAPALKEESRGASLGTGAVRWRKGMVIAQAGISIVLLVAAGLFARSLRNLQTTNPGFRTENLTVFQMDPLLSGYDALRSRQVHDRVRQELLRLPGVERVALGGNVPLSGSLAQVTANVEGYTGKEGENLNIGIDAVGAGYLAALGIPLLAGREISDEDILKGRKVAVVNQKFVRYFYPAQNPLGRHIAMGRGVPDIEIVGVAADSQFHSLRESADRFAYVTNTDPNMGSSAVSFFIRSHTLPPGWAEAVRKAVQRADSRTPVVDLKTMEVQVSESIYIERMMAAVAIFFGLAATLLAAIGLYGVMAFRVSQRTREIGIRMALGAHTADVLKIVLGEVGWLGFAGILLGLPAAMFLSRFAKAQLFGVAPLDACTLFLAPLALLAVMMAAGLLPARRAMSVEPVRALHYE